MNAPLEMTPVQALELLQRSVGELELRFEQHVQLQHAVAVLRGEIAPPKPSLVPKQTDDGVDADPGKDAEVGSDKPKRGSK